MLAKDVCLQTLKPYVGLSSSGGVCHQTGTERGKVLEGDFVLHCQRTTRCHSFKTACRE